MVGKTGFEPATPWSQTRCTTKLCYFPFYFFFYSNGALGRNRTHNLLIRSQALYPVELLAHLFNSASILYHIRCSFATLFLHFFQILFLKNFSRNGAQGRSRTGTDFKVRRILSPVRLPISPPGQQLEVPAGLEPTMTELQSVALPTWLWNRFCFSLSVAQLVYNIFLMIARPF